MNRTEQIKGYLKRLGDGESLENVKKDFVKEFNDVNPIEIMEAEQALIAEGTPISEVSKLCDVHSALFHGAVNTSPTTDLTPFFPPITHIRSRNIPTNTAICIILSFE